MAAGSTEASKQDSGTIGAGEKPAYCQTCRATAYPGCNDHMVLHQGKLVGCPRWAEHARRQSLFPFPERYQSAVLDPGIPEHQRVIEHLEDSRKEDRLRGSSILLAGIYGGGKTHIACAACNLVRGWGFSTLFVPTVDLLEELRSSYEAGADMDESDVLDACRETDFLALDDYGKEKIKPEATAWALEKLYRVINARYNARRPTLVTTNLSKAEFGQSDFGAAITERILEGGLVIGFQKSRRPGPIAVPAG